MDYISEEEIKELVKTEIIDSIKKDKERIFNNAVSRFLGGYMNEQVNKDIKDELIKKTKKAIKEKDLSYELFKSPDAWDRDEKACYKILQQESQRHRNILEERVKEVFSNLSSEDLSYYIKDRMNDLFVKLLTD